MHELWDPADLLDYDVQRLKAVVLEEGSPTDHVAIVARAFDVPVVGRVPGLLLKVEEGDPIVVDGKIGQVYVRPSEEVREPFAKSVHALVEQKPCIWQHDLPAVTLDNVSVALNLNAGLLLDLEHLRRSGVEGIGLTEDSFMIRQGYPDVATQEKKFTVVFWTKPKDKPVTFRTLDVGATRFSLSGEDRRKNPAMGWRAIRHCAGPAGHVASATASLSARQRQTASSRNVPHDRRDGRVFKRTAALLHEIDRAKDENRDPPSRLDIGVMLESPPSPFSWIASYRSQTSFLSAVMT